MATTELVKMRVKEGKRPLPYNDGSGPKEHKPGEIFEAPARFLVEFRDHVEAVDEAGNVIDSGDVKLAPDAEVVFRQSRPHERVSMLEDLRAKRLDAQKREIEALDQQIEQEKQAAVKDAEERHKRASQPAEAPSEAAKQPARPRPANKVVSDATVERVNE